MIGGREREGRKEVWRVKRKEGVGRVLQREGGCGRGRTEWEREGRERGAEEGMEGETKGGSVLQRQGGRDGYRREGGREEGS